MTDPRDRFVTRRGDMHPMGLPVEGSAAYVHNAIANATTKREARAALKVAQAYLADHPSDTSVREELESLVLMLTT